MAKKYNVSWHTFIDHLHLMFKELYEEGKHSDVTLVSDDQIQFKAHKIVLSACSPVFKKIIDSNPSQHPLIYLRGIQSYELESILQFMYLGEARFYQDRMEEFIKVAKDLEVKDISDSFGSQYKNQSDVKSPKIIESESETQTTEDVINEVEIKSEKEIIENVIIPSKAEADSEGGSLSTTKDKDCPACGSTFFDKAGMVRHFRAQHEGLRVESCHRRI